MKNTKVIIAGIAAILVLAAGGIAIHDANRQPSKTAVKSASTQTAKPAAKLTTSSKGYIVSYDGQSGKTALEILKSLATVTTKQSSYGEFVTGINGIHADGTMEYWAFYVNGKLADEGAGSYKTADGQKILWRVEDVQK